jgi:hypothetical protein
MDQILAKLSPKDLKQVNTGGPKPLDQQQFYPANYSGFASQGVQAPLLQYLCFWSADP